MSPSSIPETLANGRSEPTLAELARIAGLHPVGGRPALRRYVQDLLSRRAFVWQHSSSRVQSTHARARLGNLWLVVTPLVSGAIYYFVFGVLLEASRGVTNYVGYLLVGVFLFQFTARSASEGAKALPANRKLLQSVRLPAAALPISAVLRQVFTTVPAVVVMLAVVLAAPPVEQVTWRWILLVPVLALQTCFNLGLALWLARPGARSADLPNLVTHATRIWLYLSGVFYSFDHFVEDPALLRILQGNPIHVLLSLARSSLLYATTPSASDWLLATGWAAGMFVSGFWFFYRGEGNYGRE